MRVASKKYFVSITLIVFTLSANADEAKNISSTIVLEKYYGKVITPSDDAIKNSKDKRDKLEYAIWTDVQSSIPIMLKGNLINMESDKAEVRPAFEAFYEEGDIKKYLLVTQAIPVGTAGNYTCHACSPLIGIMSFIQKNGEWMLEGKNIALGHYGSWGYADGFSILANGIGHHTLAVEQSSTAQGYISKNITLHKASPPYQNMLSIGFNGAGDGACLDKAAKNKQSISVLFIPDSSKDIYDAEVVLSWNKPPCGKVVSVNEKKRFSYSDNGKYTEINQ